MNKKLIYGAIVIVLIVIVAFMGFYGFSSVTGNIVSEETIKIGGIFHLSGPGAFWGGGEYNGAILAIEEINEEGMNGKKLELVVEDGETDFPKTVSGIRKLSDVNGVEFIIGPTWFGQVGSPLAEELEVLMISPSAGSVPEPNPYFFDVWPTERQEIIPLVGLMKENNVERIAIVYSLNEWSQSMRDNFVEESSEQGLVIIEEFPTTPDEEDFRTIITKLKELEIDAVYAPFAFYPSQGAFSKQSEQLNLETPLYSSSGTENPILLESFPKIEGTIYPYPAKGSGEEEFGKKYFRRFGVAPSPPAAYAYDTVYLLVEALEDGNDSPEEISSFLMSLENYQGVSNIISFNEDGRVVQKEHVIKIVRSGKFVDLE